MVPEAQLPAASEGGANASARVYAASEPGVPLRQGELLMGLRVKKLAMESVRDGSENLLVEVHHPYVFVATQDCDLEQDYSIRQGGGDKAPTLPSILLYEVVTAKDLKSTRSDLSQGSQPWNNARQNKNERYHFFERVPAECDAQGAELPELAIDFKRYVTVPTDELYERIDRGQVTRRCQLISPYLEHWAFRHSAFQCRVALPRPHDSE